MTKLTPWFPADVQPVRRGLYEVQTDDFEAPNYRVWLGDGWSGTYGSPRNYRDARPLTERAIYPPTATPWRGLLKDEA